ncbi:MAG TPA: hypothetical protein VLF69_01395 [Candidatus Saccharimonadales bacterium]|nr:hypothetical protein [Candidatus Saccharimonadales bacterium]
MAPLPDPTALERITKFFGEQGIGWAVLSSEGGRMLNVVPPTGGRLVDGVGYYFTDRESRMDWFEDHSDPAEPAIFSEHTRGWRLPRPLDLIERPLVVPTDNDLDYLIARGNQPDGLLDAHTTVQKRDHAGRWEVRFCDPLLLVIRAVGPKRTKSYPGMQARA